MKQEIRNKGEILDVILETGDEIFLRCSLPDGINEETYLLKIYKCPRFHSLIIDNFGSESRDFSGCDGNNPLSRVFFSQDKFKVAKKKEQLKEVI